ADAEPGDAGGVELLVDDRVVAEVLDPQPAVLLRRLPQQQPGLPGLAPHLAVDVALLLPFLDVGGAFLLEERPGQGAELLVLGSVQSPFHRRSPSSGNQRGAARLLLLGEGAELGSPLGGRQGLADPGHGVRIESVARLGPVDGDDGQRALIIDDDAQRPSPVWSCRSTGKIAYNYLTDMRRPEAVGAYRRVAISVTVQPDLWSRFEPVDLSDRELALQRQVREFCDRELPHGSRVPGLGMNAVADPEFSRRLAARGWLGMALPKRYGGGDRSAVERFVVIEELLRRGAPIGHHWVADRQSGPVIARFGTEEQKERFLPGI